MFGLEVASRTRPRPGPMRAAGAMLRARVGRPLLPAALMLLALFQSARSDSVSLDWTAPPGANYAEAQFRFWSPPAERPIRAIIVLTTGINADGRPMASDPRWQDFAARHGAALIACRFTNRPKLEGPQDAYSNASNGSGKALLDALSFFAGASGLGHAAELPLLLWGFSAGGQFNYEFVAWKPERVAAFVVNKGGVYLSRRPSEAARNVPGLLILGQNDLEWRNEAIRNLFLANQGPETRWSFVEEPYVGHEEGNSRLIAEALFSTVLERGLASRPAEKQEGPDPRAQVQPR